jgi:glycosyltransferase involved in cell wall biosynthesis
MSIVISYLVPSYNHEKYIITLLESIRSDRNYLQVSSEVIIIDDGSTDGSSEIIKQWVAHNLKGMKIIYNSQTNKGIGSVLNSLIEISTGNYLRMCSSDDVIVAGSTQILLNKFKNKQELFCVVGDGQVINAEGSILHESSLAFHGGSLSRLANSQLLVEELIKNWCVAGPSFLIKRSHYQNMNYDESSKIDDLDLFLSLLKKPGALVFVDNVVCLYRVHFSNTSKTQNILKRIDNMKSFLKIIDKYIGDETLKGYLQPLKYKSNAKVYFFQKKFFKCGLNLLISMYFKLNMKMNGCISKYD